MNAPRIRNIDDAHPDLLAALPALPGTDGVAMFVVTGEGVFAGRRWGVGDVVVCRGDARTGDATVLIARGHGRPRLGSVRGTRVWGDAGEPCHPGRWLVAGRMVAHYRSTPHGWVVDLVEPGVMAEAATPVGEQRQAASALRPTRAPRRAAAGQLSLFAA